MKRLVDEGLDELTRSLLEAGRAHQPPAGNEAKLLLTLGVGGSVGLFSSKAFAWLGSGAGKLTLVGVGMGVAGVAYTLVSARSASVRAPASAETVLARSMATSAAPVGAAPEVASSTVLPQHVISERAALQPRAVEVGQGSGMSSSGMLPRGALPSGASAGDTLPSGALPSETLPSSTPSSGASSGAPAPSTAISATGTLIEAPLDRAPGAHRHAHRRRGRVAAPTYRTRAAGGSEPNSSLASAATTNGAMERDGAASEARGSEAAGSVPEGSESASSTPAARATRPGLDSEVALVDAMRSALARGDGAALHRLIESYRGSFPHGQLQAEVAELAARPLPSGR